MNLVCLMVWNRKTLTHKKPTDNEVHISLIHPVKSGEWSFQNDLKQEKSCWPEVT